MTDMRSDKGTDGFLQLAIMSTNPTEPPKGKLLLSSGKMRNYNLGFQIVVVCVHSFIQHISRKLSNCARYSLSEDAVKLK